VPHRQVVLTLPNGSGPIVSIAGRCFDAFREEYNTARPHEALADETPASIYTSSPRLYPSTLPPLEYPPHFEVRLVSTNGVIRWQ